MKRRIIALCLLAVLLVSVFAGCNSGSDVVTQEEAQQIVLDHLDRKADEVEMHVHTTTVDEAVCWSVYVTIYGHQLQYVIHGVTGEILSINESNHSH